MYSKGKNLIKIKMILVNAEQQNLTTITQELNINNITATVNFNYLSKEKSERIQSNR